MSFSLIIGTVIKGLGLAKKLGLPPTMNLKARNIPKSLEFGVYAVEVKIGQRKFPGVLHYGPRPTLKAPVSFEIHCVGLKRKMYGKRVSVRVIKRLRAIKRFSSNARLKKAITNDIERACEILKLQS